jgi:hypothetical protein
MTPHSRTALLIVRIVGMLLMIYGFMQLATFVPEMFLLLAHGAFLAFFIGLLKNCIPLAAGYIVSSQSRPIAEWLTRDLEQ